MQVTVTTMITMTISMTIMTMTMTICDAADAHDNDYVVAGAPQGEKGSVQGQTGVHLAAFYPSGLLGQT